MDIIHNITICQRVYPNRTTFPAWSKRLRKKPQLTHTGTMTQNNHCKVEMSAGDMVQWVKVLALQAWTLEFNLQNSHWKERTNSRNCPLTSTHKGPATCKIINTLIIIMVEIYKCNASLGTPWQLILQCHKTNLS